MKPLLIALTILAASATGMTAQNVTNLWKEVEKAEKAGKPQTAAGYLKQIEKAAADSGDGLERYYVADRLYNALSRYNWKEANAYYPTLSSARKSLFDNLDASIEKYKSHPRAIILLYERMLRHQNAIYAKGDKASGEDWKSIRKECADLLASTSDKDYRNRLQNNISSLDRKELYATDINQTAPGREVTVSLTARNIDKVSMTLYRLPDGALFENVDDNPEKSLKSQAKQISVRTFSDLKNEYSISEEADVQVYIPQPGKYVLYLSAGGVHHPVSINASNVAGALRVREGKVEIYAADLTSGQPLDKVTAAFYDEQTGLRSRCIHIPAVSLNREYSLDGFTVTEVEDQLRPAQRRSVMLCTNEDKGAPALWIPDWQYERNAATSREVARNDAFILTDRALYHSGDSIFFKIICYAGSGLRGSVLPDRPVEVSLRHNSERDPVLKTSLTTNSMGSASGCFKLPDGAKNGTYSIQTDGGGYASVRVETYRRPTFSIEMTKSRDIHCFGDIVSQEGKVTSFAGYPVAGAKVEYEVSRRYFPRKGYSIWFNEQTIAKGTAVADNAGLFKVSFTAVRPDIDDPDRMAAASYLIRVKVTDPQGETHESSASIPVSDSPVDINIDIESKESLEQMSLVDKSRTDSFEIRTTTLNGTPCQMQGTYELWFGEKLYRKDSFTGNRSISCWFADMPSGVYTVKASTEYRGRVIESERKILSLGPDDSRLPVSLQYFYYPIRTEGAMEFLLGTTEDDLYLNMEILDGHKVLHRELVHLRNEMRHFNLPFLPEYGTDVHLQLFGFRNGQKIEHTYQFTNPNNVRFDLKFEFLRDRTTPGKREKITLKAVPGSESVISIFDVTTDRYGANWFGFHPLSTVKGAAIPYVTSTVGSGIRIRGVTKNYAMAKSEAAMANGTVLYAANAIAEDSAAEEEAPAEEPLPEIPDIDLRENFNECLGFFPHVMSGADSTATVQFTAGDLLGTFRVLALAHTKDLKVGNADTSFIVQKPVSVVPSLPLFAREGDRIVLKAKIVNLTEKEVKGTAYIEITDQDGKKVPAADSYAKPLTLLAEAQGEAAWTIVVPKAEKLNVKILYSDGNISDGELNSITVEPDAVTLTEAASFIIGGGKDFKYYEKDLRAKFGKFNPVLTRAEYSTLDAVKESLPEAEEPKSDNAIEWMNQLYINQMRAHVLKSDADTAFMGKAVSHLASLQGSDGGFRWFSGMPSSETVTLYVLEKMSQLLEAGALTLDPVTDEMVGKAVRYVDILIESIYSRRNPSNYSNIRMMSVRSRWMGRSLSKEADKGFKAFLSGTEDGWQNISILQKAQLCRTLQRCEGTSYADKSFKRRIDALAASLKDYAVANPTIGCYFPNAVMPFRGLMNNEIYAHSQLMELFSALGSQKMVDGLAQWMLLQKHNQAWENTVATTDAVNALTACKAKDLKFGAVYCTYTTQMDKVVATANEISVERSFTRVADGRKLEDGDTLKVGDQIVVRYVIWNSENRSFVQMEAMRPSCFYPKDERSGYNWGGFYREMKESSTNYYWELLPEEYTTIEERFFVTQEGTFSSGLTEIECLYAKEYRGHTASGTVTTGR